MKIFENPEDEKYFLEIFLKKIILYLLFLCISAMLEMQL